MDGYAPRQPRERSGESLVDVPAALPAAKSWGANAAVSSVITLQDNTTILEVTAIGGAGIAIKWIASTDTQASVVSSGANANFDNIVPANWRQRFVVPIATQGVPSIVGLNKQNGLYNRVAWIATAAPSSSVFAAEF